MEFRSYLYRHRITGLWVYGLYFAYLVYSVLVLGYLYVIPKSIYIEEIDPALLLYFFTWLLNSFLLLIFIIYQHNLD